MSTCVLRERGGREGHREKERRNDELVCAWYVLGGRFEAITRQTGGLDEVK